MTGMLGKLTASLKLHVIQSVVFLHPPKNLALSHTNTGVDPMVSGHVVLNLPRSRHVSAVVVSLLGTVDLAIPNRTPERGHTIDKELRIKVDRLLEKGEHVFDFAFVIPSTTAPFERSVYGRVFHKLTAKAIGAGLAGGTIEDDTFVTFIVNPGAALVDDGGGYGPSRGVAGPHALEILVEDFAPELGPYSISLSSPHVTPSGAVRVNFNLPAPPSTHHIRVHHFAVYIEQKFSLFSGARSLDADLPPEAVSPPPMKRTVLRLDAGWKRSLTTEEWEKVLGSSGRKGAEMTGGSGHDDGAGLAGNGHGRTGRTPSRPPPSTSTRSSSRDGVSSELTRIRLGTPEPSPPGTARSSGIDLASLSIHGHGLDSTYSNAVAIPPPSLPYRASDSPNGSVSGTPASSSIPRVSSSPGPTTTFPFSSSRALSSLPGIPASEADTTLLIIPAGSPLKLTRIARMPDDNMIRPSTMQATQTPIRVGHEIVVECVYDRIPAVQGADVAEPGKKRALRMRREITISSCCCTLDSLVLPSYTKCDPNAGVRKDMWDARSKQCQGDCICGESMERVLGQAFKDEEGLLGNEYAPIQEGVRFRAYKRGEAFEVDG